MKLTAMYSEGSDSVRLRFKFKNGLQLSVIKNSDETYDVMAIASDGIKCLTDHFCSISSTNLDNVNYAIEEMEKITSCALCGHILIDKKETQDDKQRRILENVRNCNA